MAEIRDEGGSSLSGTFRYEPDIVFNLAMSLIMGFLTFALWKVEHDGSDTSGVIMVWVTWAGFLFGFLIRASQHADVIVDAQGISRRLFGLVPWKRQRWDNIRLIRVMPFPYRDPYTGSTSFKRIIVMLPAVPPRLRWVRSGKVALDDAVNEAGVLMKIINHYIAQYNIKTVELVRPMGEKQIDHL